MTISHHNALRAELTNLPDGITAQVLAAKLNIKLETVKNSLKSMADVYVDRYTTNRRKVGKFAYVPVYCAITIPADAPHPNS